MKRVKVNLFGNVTYDASRSFVIELPLPRRDTELFSCCSSMTNFKYPISNFKFC